MTSVLLEDLGQDLAMMARLVQSQLISGMTAFFQRDVKLADQVMHKDDPGDNLPGLIETKFLERIGDSILNIGETTLFILTGERLKLHQYLHLEQVAGAVAPHAEGTLDFRQIWGGISGSRIGRVGLGEGEPLIWKEGDERKIDEELREMEEWNRIVP